MVRDSLAFYQEYFRKHERIRVFDAHTSTVHSVAWNCDGRRLASGSVDKTVCVSLFDMYKLRQEFTCRGHSDQVDQVSWHQTNPDLLASASGDKTTRIWDVKSKKAVGTVNTKGQNINVGWSPDGSVVAIGDKDDKISFIDARTWKVRFSEQFRSETNEFVWDPSSQFFFVSTGGGQVHIFKWPEMKLHLVLQAHPSQANCLSIKIDPTGKHFAIGGGDALITLWDLPNLVCLTTVDRLDWPVRTVSFSHDGQLLAAGSEDHCIDVSWVKTAEKVTDLKCDGETYTMAWHPKEYILAFACDDRMSSGYRESGHVKLYGFSQEQI